jgi:hypothetical protein
VIDAGLYALLAANSGVQALVGDSIFAGVAPDDLAQYPCIAYSLVGGSSEPTMNSSGVIRGRVQIDCFAAAPSGSSSPGTVAAAIRAAVIKAVNGWQQLLGDGTNVLDAELLNPGTDFVSEDRIFRAMCEFYILYTFPTT